MPFLWPDPNTAYGYNDAKVKLPILSPASKERNENGNYLKIQGNLGQSERIFTPSPLL